jgi:hypothetical protein
MSTAAARVQEQCGLEEGELRCIFAESQSLGRPRLDCRIADAKAGLPEQRHLEVADLRTRAPWG